MFCAFGWQTRQRILYLVDVCFSEAKQEEVGTLKCAFFPLGVEEG